MSGGKQAIEARKQEITKGLVEIYLEAFRYIGPNPNGNEKGMNDNGPSASESGSSTKDDKKG